MKKATIFAARLEITATVLKKFKVGRVIVTADKRRCFFISGREVEENKNQVYKK